MINVENHGPIIAIRMSRSLLGRPICWTAAYWVDGLLIDTGPSCTAHELARILEQVHVEQIVLTHGHEDHSGGLALLHERYPDAPIYAARRTIPFIQEPDRLGQQFYRHLLWGAPKAVKNVQSIDAIDNVIKTPEYQLRMVETPGYTADHVSLWEPTRRWLFCGDTFSAGREQAWMKESDLFSMVCSLRTLASLRPERLFPGSGNVRRTPQPEIHHKIRQLVTLTQEVAKLEAIRLTIPEIVACLFQEEPRLTFWTGGHFSAANLIEACQAYNSLFIGNNELARSYDPSVHDKPRSTPGSSRSTTDRPSNADSFGNL